MCGTLWHGTKQYRTRMPICGTACGTRGCLLCGTMWYHVWRIVGVHRVYVSEAGCAVCPECTRLPQRAIGILQHSVVASCTVGILAWL